MVKVNITALYNLIKNKELVPTEAVVLESQTLYKFLKLEGAKHVNVYHIDENNEHIYEKVEESDFRIRAMACLILRIMHRWNDKDTRLEHHFELPTAVSDILDLKELTKPTENSDDYSYITIRMLVENYTGKKFHHNVEER